ncbi:MAG: hypothetical protein MUF84_12485 [Anaerolineae bacterium]|jgi:hypothetical protein|nr:hypothetical protein [Anaerolineae bacterium]
MTNLLRNPGFEGEWWRETASGGTFGEIFVPKPWVAYWREGLPVPHDPLNNTGYGRPEIQVINREAPFLVPLRVRSGNRAVKLFTFYRIHDAGLFQQVQGVHPGSRLRGTAWSHAWSSTADDPTSSEGVGNRPFFVRTSDPVPDSLRPQEGLRNVTFTVGIDPKGGIDPWSSDVVWGEGAHIYNGYAQIPPVEVIAATSTVTLFVRSSVMWPFKHCDAYLDDVQLVMVGEPSEPIQVAIDPEPAVVGQPFEIRVANASTAQGLTFTFSDQAVFAQAPHEEGDQAVCRAVAVTPGMYEVRIASVQGASVSAALKVDPAPAPPQPDCVAPREPYSRTYLLLPPDVSGEWLLAVASSGVWDRRHWTIGSSADDAGIGPRVRRVIAVNPKAWGGDLERFFDEAYPGIEYHALIAGTPAELLRLLRAY